MIRAALLSLMAAPSAAATLPAIEIHECVSVSVREAAYDVEQNLVARADLCGPRTMPDLPPWFPTDSELLALKWVDEDDPAPMATSTGHLPGAALSPRAALPARATAAGGRLIDRPGVPRSFPCGCYMPPEKQPAPIPLPASVWMLAAAVGLLRGIGVATGCRR